MEFTPQRQRASARAAEEDWRPISIDRLEPAADAALRDSGCTAVMAGPGAGKTEFLAQRAAFLLQTGRCPWPSRILSISYKRDSAAGLRRRVAERVPERADRFVSVTFDAFAKGLLDRFRAALPVAWRLRHNYEVKFWTEREVRDFLTALASRTADPAVKAELCSLQPAVLRNDLRSARLPPEADDEPTTARALAVWSWWNDHYRSASLQRVDFTMLNRVAILLLEQRPQILHALQSTYPFVFVDEFQDTTPAQLELLSVAFPPPAAVTAVGDFKQRIMGFAGAHQSAIGAFIADFGATPYELTWNFRSTPALVDLQHVIARALDPAVSKGVSMVTAETGHVPVQLWTYDHDQAQARHLASWIAAEIAASDRQPSDFVFVARQKVADLEAVLAPALADFAIRLRNDDVRYGELTLQDLLKHDVTRLLLGLLRLAAQPIGLGSLWIDTTRTLANITGAQDQITERRLSDQTGRSVADLGMWLSSASPSTTRGAEVVRRAADVTDSPRLRGWVAAAGRGDNLDAVLNALTRRIDAIRGDCISWSEVVDAIEGADAVTLLTIHRSKGLEYHTVIFLGLDDDQWWAHQRDTHESTSTFFVGLSRAAQRLIFTCAAPSSRRQIIADLYAALETANVKTTHWRWSNSQ